MILLSYKELEELRKVHPQIRKACAATVREVAKHTALAPTFKNAALTFTSFRALKISLAAYVWEDKCRERFGN